MKILKSLQNDSDEEDLENLLSTEVVEPVQTPPLVVPPEEKQRVNESSDIKFDSAINNNIPTPNHNLTSINDNNNEPNEERLLSKDIVTKEEEEGFTDNNHHNNAEDDYLQSNIDDSSKCSSEDTNTVENNKQGRDIHDITFNESCRSVISEITAAPTFTDIIHNTNKDGSNNNNNLHVLGTNESSESAYNDISTQEDIPNLQSENYKVEESTCNDKNNNNGEIVQIESKIESASILESDIGTLASVALNTISTTESKLQKKSLAKTQQPQASNNTTTSSSSVAQDNGVVFMGWKSNHTEEPTTTTTTTDTNSNQYNSPPNMKKINKLKKTSSSAPERQKKNIWQGMLSNHGARWRSPHNNNNQRKKFPGNNNKDISGGGGEEENHVNMMHKPKSPISIGRNDNELTQGYDELVANENSTATYVSNMDDHKATTPTADLSTPSKSNKSIARNLDDGGHFGDEKDFPNKPLSPPPLRFQSTSSNETQQSNNNLSVNINDTSSIVGVVTATPTKQRKKPFGRNNNMKIQPVKPSRSVSRSSDQSNIMHDDTTMQKEFVQIKPFHRYLEGFQMSASELYQEMMRKSNHVEMLKSTQLVNGKNGEKSPIGSLKVELLACMGLPQIRRAKPNSIAYFVCGDTAFATDIIQSSLSPMWPARSRRAACFPIFNAYARLYTGIFSVTDKDNDDYIGRSVIDIASLRPNADYDVALPLRSSGNVYDPEPRGVVRLRFHLTWNEPNAPILSYLPSKLNEVFVNPDEPSELVTIPCADPKSQRNVAFTIHGEDLFGKYSKKAFRATNRELNLYKFQTPLAFKRTLVQLMTYEKPLASTYIFVGWMSILCFRIYHLVPSYIVSLAIVVHVVNYYDLALNDRIDSGFEPLSVREICNSLVRKVLPETKNSKPPQSQCYDLESYLNAIGDVEIPLEDNLTFPFSDPKYAKSTLKSMLCPKVVYNKKRNGEGPGNKDDTSSGDSGDSDDNDSMSDGKVVDEENEDNITLNPNGPEQDDNIETRENTFQENLKSIENVLHSLTGDYFHEQISRSIQRSNEELDNTEGIIPGAQTNKFTNPLAALSSTFLEPILNVINVYILAVRTVFNITHWKDPYLSFLFLVMLIVLMLLLAVFPWRSFFYTSGTVLFGPQNYGLKRYIEKFFAADDFDEIYIDENNKKVNRRKKRKQRHNRKEARKDGGGSGETFDRPLFGTPHGTRQHKKKNVEPVEVVVPYARARKERFYFWPPYSLRSKSSLNNSQAMDTEDYPPPPVEKKTQ